MTFPTSERDADDQLAEARRAAYAWLRATLSMLPAAVTSLSVGAVLDDGGDRPTLAPRLRASVSGFWNYPVDMHVHPQHTRVGDAMQALYDIDDDIRTRTAPFLFAIAIADEEWMTVTRAELASERTAELCGVEHRIDPMASLGHDSTTHRWVTSKNTAPTMEDIILAHFTQALRDIPSGTNITLRVYRDACGHLTWTLLNP